VIIHLVHGIHSTGQTPIEALGPYLPFGTHVAYPDYGFILGLETRVVNPIITGCLRPYISPTDIMICHSNGCAIAYDLMHSGVVMAGAVFINAALEQNIIRPATVPWIDVYFNAGDTITEAARVGAILGIDDPVWGEMGHAGYLGTDKGIANIDCGKTAGLPVVDGHSDFFTPGNLAGWGPFLAQRLAGHGVLAAPPTLAAVVTG
jgi:hypothetical protein